MICQASEVFSELNPRQVLGLIQPFVDEGHGSDTVLAFLEHLQGLSILDIFGLKVEQTGNDLQIVFDPVK